MRKIGMITLGCNKNRVDSEIALGLLKERGWEITQDFSAADALMVNTCGFIGAAKEESIDAIMELAEHKKTGRCRCLIVSGCLAQRYEQALWDEIPEIDLLLGVNQYAGLADAVDRVLNGGGRARSCMDPLTFYEHDRVLTTPGYSAYIRIGEGCSNRCTFCAIPLIRGGYRSRNRDTVLREIGEMAARGVKEHILVAQDTTRYGTDWQKHSALPELLRDAAAIPGVRWLRVLYCYPDETDERLLDIIAQTPNICSYLDLPIQHISGRILRRMARRGGPEDIRRCVRLARERGLTTRTSIIVGFPGETEAEFEELLAFLREARFDRLGAFTYSPEEGTPAADFPDQVEEEVKQDRLDRLMRLQAEISLAANRERVGTEETVLITAADGRAALGRSEREAPESDGEIRLTAPRPLEPGGFVRARLTAASTYDLKGVVLP